MDEATRNEAMSAYFGSVASKAFDDGLEILDTSNIEHYRDEETGELRTVPPGRKMSPIPAPTEEYAATGQQLVNPKIIEGAVDTILQGPSFQDSVDEAAIKFMEQGRQIAEQASQIVGLDADTIGNTLKKFTQEAAAEVKGMQAVAPLYDVISVNLKKYEGYRVDGRDNQVINVPWRPGMDYNKSGITMGGIDIGQDMGNLDLLYQAYSHNREALTELQKLEGARGLKQQDAVDYFKKSGVDISKLRDDRGLSNSYITVAKNIGAPKVLRHIPEYQNLPTKLQGALVSHAVLGAHKNSFGSVKTAMESGKKEDWEKAYRNFANYGWRSNKKHNQMRSDEVAMAIRELIDSME